jgi:hypothetical protein
MAGLMPDYNAQISEQLAKIEGKRNDLFNAAQIAGWGGPTAIGAGLGALTAPKNKGLQSTLRGAGLGAALHAGTSLGARAGSALAGGGSPTGTLLGAGIGGLGSTLAAQYLLPRVDDDETPNKKEKSAMSFYSFGAKLAAAPQAVNMNANGAPQAGDMGDHLNEQVNLIHKLVGQGKAKYPYNPNPPFNPVQAAGVRNNPAAPPLKAPAPALGKAGSFVAFGAKLANYVDLHNAPEPTKKQLPHHEVFNNALMRAEAAGEKPSSELFGRIQKEHNDAQKKEKKAQSSCSPCAMPNGPTNGKKPYTSASPAVTDASQKSVEIGKPPVTETEHSEAKAKQPEEGAKSAYAFGRKVAAGFDGVTGVPYSPQSLAAPSNYADLADDMRANQFSPSGAKNTAPRLSTGTGQLVAKQQHLNKLQTELNNAPRTNIQPRNMADTVVDAWAAAPGNVANAITNTGKSIAAYGGPRNALDTAVDGYMTGFNALTSAPGKALASAQKLWNEGGNDGGRGYQGPPGSTPQVSGKVGPKPDVAGAGAGAAGGGILDMLYNNRYPIAGGLGALGLGGLLYHLNSQPKKKKRDEEEV